MFIVIFCFDFHIFPVSKVYDWLCDSISLFRGIQQAEAMRAHLAVRPSGGRTFTSFDLVVVSPLTRTLETCHHIFSPARKPGVPDFLDFRPAPDGSGEVVRAPRVLVREECRERWGRYVCDGRRPVSELIKEFPDFDFSAIRHDRSGCIRREGTSEAVRQAVGGGCESGWGRLLSVTNAIEAGTWHQEDSGWA